MNTKSDGKYCTSDITSFIMLPRLLIKIIFLKKKKKKVNDDEERMQITNAKKM
jgi:hypothetical protein